MPGEFLANLPVVLQNIQVAATRIKPFAIRTPLLPLPYVQDVFIKPENLQRTGSFKFRGAFNALSMLSEAERSRGVVADSSGNHAQGVAAAAKILGIPATIVIPENAPSIKVERTKKLGAEIVRCPNSSDQRMRVAKEIQSARNMVYIPPFDHADIIAGAGTIGLEIIEDLPSVKNVLVCVGGGGLSAGVATAIKNLKPIVKIFGVEPELAADAQESLRTGHRVSWDATRTTRTICDGVRTQQLGEKNFVILQRLLDEIVTVSDDEVIVAMRWLALESKMAVEPTGALTLAALLSGRLNLVGPTVCVISGGNFDPNFMARILDS